MKPKKYFWNCIGWPCLVLSVTAYGLGSSSLLAEPAPSASLNDMRFKFEHYNALGGTLYKSSGRNSDYDDQVTAVFVDTKDRVWVGTQNGLAVYVGEQWTNRTFPVKGLSPVERAAFQVLQISNCGPDKIVEGPPGTIWLGGHCGLWRFQDGEYEEIKPGLDGSILAMAVDDQGALWIVNKERVQRYDGRSWNTVLCPYIGKPKSVEASGLYGIVIDTNGSIWTGGTVYGNPMAPWEIESPIWVVDQKLKQRGDGPPMAALFEFDGKRWRAFGPSDGLDVKRATPELNAQGRIVVKTSRGHRIWEGDTWKSIREPEINLEKRWVLRKRKRGLRTDYAELLYHDGQHLVQVRPANAETGEVLDLRSERRPLLHIAEDLGRGCVWLGTSRGLYKICPEEREALKR